MSRRSLLLISLVAIVHGLLFIVYVRPDWDVAWSDQAGYRRLGAVLAENGRFTRYPDYPVFVPEVIRTPGYPLFVAAIYKMFGIGNDVAVTIAQSFVFAAICLLVYAMGRRIAGRRTGIAAAAITALFPPLPYFGALVLTELWTAFMLTAAMWALVGGVYSRRVSDFVLAGVLLSCTTLVRPAFVLLPYFLAIGLPLLVKCQRERQMLTRWAVLVVAATITLAPWFAYNYANFGRLTLSPAGGIGRGLWEGTWQARWPGRVQAALTSLAASAIDRTTLDERVQALAREARLDPGSMLQYVHEWRDINAVWDTPRDPLERVRARVDADGLYYRAALTHIREDPPGHVMRRLTRGFFFLWAADVPIRYTQISRVPTLVIRAIWLAQVILLALGAFGAALLARRGRWLETVLLVLPLVYVTGVHLPLLCETRQSLPVKPLVLLLAAVAVVRPTFPESAGS